MMPRHEVVEEGRGNAVLNRGPRQGELECQGSQRVHIWTHPVCKDSSCSGAPRYDCGHISDLLVGHRVSLALMECALFRLISSVTSKARTLFRFRKSGSYRLRHHAESAPAIVGGNHAVPLRVETGRLV